MEVKVSMTLDEWKQQKEEEHKKGRAQGMQKAIRFLGDVLQDPSQVIGYGKGFPDELIDVVDEVVDKLKRLKV